MDVRHAPLAIELPFTPTVGCRIDFKNIHIEDLTPSSMLNRHLILSPVQKLEEITPKRPNLSVISEEAVDISKELESYQLEIENSMNEAKATNKQSLMDPKKKSLFSKRLCRGADNDNEKKTKITKVESNLAAQTEMDDHLCHETSNGECPKSSTPKTQNRSFNINENPDVVYEEVNDSHISNEIQTNKKIIAETNDLFKNPVHQPFVRVYRRDVQKKSAIEPTETTTKKLEKFEPDEKSKDNKEIFGGIRSSIRKSIRKLIIPTASKFNETTPTNILTTIRHSLRRKQPKQPLATSTPRQSLNEISIIDTAETRVIYKDTAFSARVNRVDNSSLRSKNNLRSSFRRFIKKNSEDYEFGK